MTAGLQSGVVAQQKDNSSWRETALEDTRTKIKELEYRIEHKETSVVSEEYLQQRLKSLKHKEMVLSRDAVAINATVEDMKTLWDKLHKIEAKEKCLRVQFLDWLSDQLLDWSNRVHVMASRIDSPCLIEVAPRKKEESKHARESKEIARLKELLKEEREKIKETKI
jgi:succinate dehydrogenase/fumarate reductase flavoprotein subunit